MVRRVLIWYSGSLNALQILLFLERFSVARTRVRYYCWFQCVRVWCLVRPRLGKMVDMTDHRIGYEFFTVYCSLSLFLSVHSEDGFKLNGQIKICKLLKFSVAQKLSVKESRVS